MKDLGVQPEAVKNEQQISMPVGIPMSQAALDTVGNFGGRRRMLQLLVGRSMLGKVQRCGVQVVCCR